MSSASEPLQPVLPAGGRVIKGPRAFGSDPRRLWVLTRTMAITDFRLKFFGSALGYLWQLMRPLLLFGVLFVVFTEVVRLGNNVKYYSVALLLGIVLFNFFAEATAASVRSLVDRENLVRKIEFPRLAIPCATVLTALMNLGLNMIAVFVFLFAAGGELRWTVLELPAIVAFLGVFVLGLAMILAVSFVRFRDVQPIWDVALQAMFYASPVLIPVQTIATAHADTIRHILMLSPFGAALQQARHAVIDPSHPSALATAGSWGVLAMCAAICAGTFIFGLWLFAREAPKVAERL
jgi:ABC-2 type transport system permease protein